MSAKHEFSESEMTTCMDAVFEAFVQENKIPKEARDPVWDRNTKEMLLPVVTAGMQATVDILVKNNELIRPT